MYEVLSTYIRCGLIRLYGLFQVCEMGSSLDFIALCMSYVWISYLNFNLNSIWALTAAEPPPPQKKTKCHHDIHSSEVTNWSGYFPVLACPIHHLQQHALVIWHVYFGKVMNKSGTSSYESSSVFIWMIRLHATWIPATTYLHPRYPEIHCNEV